MRKVIVIGGFRPHARGTEVDFLTTAFEGQTEVMTSTTTFLFFHKQVEKCEVTKKDTRPPNIDSEDYSEVKLRGDTGRRWASFNGDYNPIHLYAWTACLFGFKRPIVHGTCISRIIIAAQDAQNATDNVDFEVSFRKPLLIPATVRIRKDCTNTTTRWTATDSKGSLYQEVTIRAT